jgi:hypothetical protein
MTKQRRISTRMSNIRRQKTVLGLLALQTEEKGGIFFTITEGHQRRLDIKKAKLHVLTLNLRPNLKKKMVSGTLCQS